MGKTVSSSKNLYTSIASILLFCCATLMVLYIYSYFRYNINVETYTESGKTERLNVGVSIEDKIFNGEICSGFGFESFVLNYSPDVTQGTSRNFDNENILHNDDSIEKVKSMAIDDYEMNLYGSIVICIIGLIILYLLRNYLARFQKNNSHE